MANREFSDKYTKYNMDTFSGRVRYWTECINPLLLLENERSLQKHQMLLDRWKSGEKGLANADLWAARRAVEQCIHPTSGDVIPPLFRMSAFLPMNFLIVPTMMAPATLTSVPRTMFIQWFNQTFNAAVNYANRSSDKQPVSEIGKAYGVAVTVACGGSLVATNMLKKLPSGTVKATIIRGTVPFIAVSTASVLNLAFMRKNEWMSGGKGIKVKDEDGTVRGESISAGRDSLAKCSATRIIWNLPCMVLPTLFMVPLASIPAIRAHPLVTETALQMLGLTLGVPPALAAFNINQTIGATSLEKEFQNFEAKGRHSRDYLFLL
ncbi:tricarboxylate carrier [Angomonas deanei]|nr:tricarboxylate carrier [Angomonas deanei]|eukprot:EPY41692.1 tricarboxylate carrier [Angomonas deanei]